MPFYRNIGVNRIFFNGLCFVGPGQPMAILGLIMLIFPCVLFNSKVIPWYYTYNHILVILFTIIFAILQIISLIAFVSTAYSDPGILPKTDPPISAFDSITEKYRECFPSKYEEFVIRGNLFRLKYCTTCNFYRTPRTIHCFVCNNCVENFDHHCPWLGNCIGRRNYRRFYIFISSTSILAVGVLMASVGKFAIITRRILHTESPQENITTNILSSTWDALVLMIYTLAITWFIVGLCAYHTYLVGTNQSTYEHIKDFYNDIVNPWDRGVWNNIVDVLCRQIGPSMLIPHKENNENPDKIENLNECLENKDDSVCNRLNAVLNEVSSDHSHTEAFSPENHCKNSYIAHSAIEDKLISKNNSTV